MHLLIKLNVFCAHYVGKIIVQSILLVNSLTVSLRNSL